MPSERYNRAVGTLIRLTIALVIVAVVVVVPLLVVQHQDCRQGKRLEDVWTVSVPFQAERLPRCRAPESGGEVLLETVGLR